MGAVRKISADVDEEVAAELDAAVASGEFDTPDDIVREALETWWQQRAETPESNARLKRLWDEGIASGEPREVTDDWYEDVIRRGRERMRAKREQN